MILDGYQTSEEIKEEIKTKVRQYLVKPCLAVIQVGNDEASNVYIRNKEKACREVGIYFKHIHFEEDVKERELVNKIIELNNDDYVNGILLQLPLPSKYDANKFLNLISKDKDVDGLTDWNIGKLTKGNPYFIPCTPLGIMTLLKRYDIEIEGKHAVIVGRSNLVSKPLAMTLLQNDATVTICHSKTKDLKQYTTNADILIVAVGKPKFITADMVKEDSVIIDVGINRVDGALCGDVDFEKVKDKVKWITPVPKGVGPMTVASLLQNVIQNYEKNEKTLVKGK